MTSPDPVAEAAAYQRHLLDGCELQHPDHRALGAAHAHPRPVPPSEQRGDRAVGDRVEDRPADQHDAILPHPPAFAFARLLAKSSCAAFRAASATFRFSLAKTTSQ